MGKYISEDKYLADYATTQLECLDSCSSWSDICPTLNLEDQIWRFEQPCSFECGGFSYHVPTSRCKLYKYSPELTYTSEDAHFFAKNAGIFSMGPCKPSGDFTRNECCPAGHSQIATEDDCEAAFNSLHKATALPEDVTWKGDIAAFEKRPSGCFLYTDTNDVYFNAENTIGNGNVMVGNDKVICKRDNIDYAVGICQPSGEFTANECCPSGHIQISNLEECHLAYLTLSSNGMVLSDATWDPAIVATPDERPSGCCYSQSEKIVQFNPTNTIENGQQMVGTDKVICRKKAEETAPQTTSPTLSPTIFDLCEIEYDGITSASGSTCCAKSCRICGGSDCKDRPGGSDACCIGAITEQCSSDKSAPCALTELDPCEHEYNGIKSEDGSTCCASSCGTCGGSGCDGRVGGADSCCQASITLMCSSTQGAPCALTAKEELCETEYNGIQSGNTCCAKSCGTCGGSGCSDRTGGANGCCSEHISDLCSSTKSAPCTLGSSFLGRQILMYKRELLSMLAPININSVDSSFSGKMDQTSLATLSTDTLSSVINDDEIKRGLVLVGSLEEKLLLTLEHYETLHQEAVENEKVAVHDFEVATTAYNQTFRELSDQSAVVKELELVLKEKTELRRTQKGILTEKHTEIGGISNALSILNKFSNVLQIVHG